MGRIGPGRVCQIAPVADDIERAAKNCAQREFGVLINVKYEEGKQ